MPRGGKRLGAGRPKSKIKNVSVKYTLPQEIKKTIKFLGGSNWIIKQVKNYLYQTK